MNWIVHYNVSIPEGLYKEAGRILINTSKSPHSGEEQYFACCAVLGGAWRHCDRQYADGIYPEPPYWQEFRESNQQFEENLQKP